MFARMGFGDRATVALIGAHTIGRAFKVRGAMDMLDVLSVLLLIIVLF